MQGCGLPSAFFVSGPGGTGKTHVYSLLLASVRLQGRVALAVASSGVAALLLEGGTFGHARFKIPLELDFDTPSRWVVAYVCEHATHCQCMLLPVWGPYMWLLLICKIAAVYVDVMQWLLHILSQLSVALLTSLLQN